MKPDTSFLTPRLLRGAAGVPALTGLLLVATSMVMAELPTQIALPTPQVSGDQPLERLLAHRRSVREFTAVALTLAEAGQLAWAAQGETHPEGKRTAPSAGALYPLELFLVAGDVKGLDPGVYHYHPKGHRLQQIDGGERRQPLARAALEQIWIREAPAVYVFGAVYHRTTGKYGERGRRYVHIEVGHAAENLILQAEALGLGSVVVGAFDDAAVASTLALPRDVKPLSILPVGRQRKITP